jgi:hypothetical protein
MESFSPRKNSISGNLSLGAKNRYPTTGALELGSKYGQVKRVIIGLTNLLPNCGQDLER